VIEAKDLRKEYRNEEVKTIALDSVTFNIDEGEFIAIMGPSGSGKSTLMHIMGFLDRLTDDELAYIRNEKMGFIFQFFNLLARTPVFDNVKLPLTYTKIPEKEKNKRVEEAIDAVGLSHRKKHLPNQLSGGEQQRVAIARAIVNHPSIIFADEPTGNLDSKSGQQIMEILQDLNEKGHTIILVTHEQYTSEMAKRVIKLKDGKIVSDEEIKNRHFAKKDGLIK